jgi:hypothetical protein
MKKITIVAAVLMLSIQLCVAQEVSESVSVTPEQVPVSIIQSYEKEIGSIPEGGTWTVRVKRSTIKGKATTTPVWYTYTNRQNKEKIEVKFSPAGEVTQAKGVTLLNGVSKSKTEETEKN